MIEGHPEVGNIIPHADLVPKTVVVLSKRATGDAMTAWVDVLAEDMVFFWVGNLHLTLGLFRDEDGSFRDNSGSAIDVQEFLGEV